MKTIRLTNSEKYILVDDEDFEKVSRLKWYIRGNEKRITANIPQCKGEPIPELADFPLTLTLGRYILGLKKGDSLHCDHINRNILDNTRKNLRACTLTQNNRNRGKYKGKYLSQYKGVSRYKKGVKPWFGQIMVNHQHIFLGTFATELEAAHAYDDAARLYFGEFASINFS